MKKIKSEVRCTKAKGKDISTEMREPFGSGIDQGRGAVAILRSFRVHRDACMLACETRIVRRTIQVLKSCNTSVRAPNEAVNSTVMRCNTELDAAHRLAMHANLGAKLAVRFVLSFLRSGWRRFAC